MPNRCDGTYQVKGGRARAEALSPEQRRAIAQQAASARWHSDLPIATHEGVLQVGDSEIYCYVLETGERILSTRGVMKSIGRSWRGRKRSGSQYPVFLEAKGLSEFVTEDMKPALEARAFRISKGGPTSEGFPADVLPTVCDVYLRARDAGKLSKSQQSVAARCEMLVRSLSRVGVIALVDEATGYQATRDRQALQELLDRYLRQEFAAWAKRFPDEFYQEMFRLKGWTFHGISVRRKKPSVVGKYTNDVVYERLAPGILEELQARNPKDSKGQRKKKHHQWLSDDIGHPALAQHLHAVIGLMRASSSWDQFKRLLDRAFPKKGNTLSLALDEPGHSDL